MVINYIFLYRTASYKKRAVETFNLLYLRILRCSMSICFGEVKNPVGVYWVKTIKQNYILKESGILSC